MSVPFFLATMKAESRARNTSVWRAREAPTEMGSAGVMPKKKQTPPLAQFVRATLTHTTSHKNTSATT